MWSISASFILTFNHVVYENFPKNDESDYNISWTIQVVGISDLEILSISFSKH